MGSYPNAGDLIIFNEQGEVLARGLYKEHHNADFNAASTLPNKEGFLIGGTVGHYPTGRGFVDYNAATGILFRR